MAHELHTKPSVSIDFGNKGVQESQVSILGPVGYGPNMWVKSRRSGDILHGFDSKVCQRVACQLYRQQGRYQGRGTKRTIFLLVERGGPIGKVLIHRWHTGMSSTIVTGSY